MTKEIEKPNFTISTIFFVPTVGINSKFLKEHNFLNGYIADRGLDTQYQDSCYLLFSPKDIAKFQSFLDSEYERTLSIITDYNLTDKYIVVVYKLDDYYRKDFDFIKQGKYSKVSDEFKELFPKEKTIVKQGRYVKEMSLQWKIFTKDEFLREYWEKRIGQPLGPDFEVWRTWEEDKEILDINQLV